MLSPCDVKKKSSMNFKSNDQKFFKVVFIGHQSVGKTSIIKRYMRNEFAMKQMNTVGVDCESKVLTIKDQMVKIQCWDTAGQERFRSMTKNYYRGCDAVVVVYDVSNKDSFDAVNSWIQDFEMKCDSKSFQKLLLANKVDMQSQRVVREQQGRDLAKQNGCMFQEISAKDGTNVEQTFSALLQSLLEEQSEEPKLKPRKNSLDIDQNRYSEPAKPFKSHIKKPEVSPTQLSQQGTTMFTSHRVPRNYSFTPREDYPTITILNTSDPEPQQFIPQRQSHKLVHPRISEQEKEIKNQNSKCLCV